MSQKHYPSPELRETSRFLLEKSVHNREPVKELDQLRLSRDLVLVDSTGGAEDVALPLASVSQGLWLAIVKTSGDGNLVRAVRKSTDLINGATAKNVGTAQYAHMMFGNDGKANWYQIA